MLDEATKERENIRLELGELANKAKAREGVHREEKKKLEVEIAYLKQLLAEKDQEIATLKAKLHRAQDTIMELEKVSSSGKPWSSAHLPASSVLIVKAQMCRRRRTATQRLR